MTKDELCGGRPAHTHGSATSETAADSMIPHAGTIRHEVLHFIRMRGSYGATDHEIDQALRPGQSTARPRRVELANRELIVNSGRTRKTSSGRAAAVWVANVPMCEEE